VVQDRKIHLDVLNEYMLTQCGIAPILGNGLSPPRNGTPTEGIGMLPANYAIGMPSQ